MEKLSDNVQRILSKYMKDKNILGMKKYKQHGDISTYDHCVHVTITGLKLAAKLKLGDEQMKNIIIGGMLHDYFLYDWHTGRMRKEGIHCFSHPAVALHKASQQFDLNTIQKNIIRSHMFPATLLHPPLSKEAVIICIADKLCAISEYAGTYLIRPTSYVRISTQTAWIMLSRRQESILL